EAAKFVGDLKSLAKEADESLSKHKALELEIERFLRAVVSQDIISVVQNNSVVDTLNLQTELERTKECFENCIIKKENEYGKLWNDWYKKMTIEPHNWSSSAHQELHKIVKDEIFPIVNQVDARVKNFEIQFLKEAAKFVGDFKSLANEADESLAKHKALELEIERLLKAVVSQDIINIVQKESVVDTSDLQTELERTKKRFENCIIKKENEYAKLWNDWYKKCDECKYDKISYDKAYKDMQQKIKRLQAQLGDLKVSKGVNNAKVIAPSMFRISLDKVSKEAKKVPNTGKKSRGRKHKANVSKNETQKEYRPKVSMSKNVGTRKSLATPKPRKPRFILRWSPIGKMFDSAGKLVAPSNSESHVDCSNGDNACTSNAMEPKIKRFPNSTSLLGRNDNVAAILGFGYLQWGNILITRVYFVEGLGHNLFSIGEFCDSDLEVAFRRNDCFVRNLKGVDLLKGDRSTNLYTINLHEMASASPICLMARASSTKLWLWHQHLSYLKFDIINDLAINDLVLGLPKFKYHTEHLCPSCEQGKSKRASHPPKPVPNSRQRLHLLHMDLCGPMRIASINGKRISVLLQSPVIIIRTDNVTEFKNQVLKENFDSVAISHQMSSVRTPQQNGVVERRNRMLVEAARTMLIFSRAPLFLWAEAIATAIFNRRTKKIMETMNVSFDELSTMAFEQRSSKPVLAVLFIRSDGH
nr:putative ribonuclease H-like domain-containing protein [Tanacetum cinerariifolium]